MAAAGTVKPNLLPLLLVLAWIVGLPAFRLFPIHVAGLPGVTPERVAFAAAAAACVLAAVRQRRAPQPFGAVELALAGYLAVAALSWITTWPRTDLTTFKQDADFFLGSFIMPAAAFAIGRNLPWTAARIRACAWVLVAGLGTVLVLWGTAQALYDWGFLLPPPLKQMHPDRAQGPFDNAVPYGVALSVLLPLALFLFLRTGRAARWGLAVLMVGLLQCIVASKTRSVWIALPVAIALAAAGTVRLRLLAALLLALLAGQILLAPRLGVDFWGLRARLTQTQQLADRVALAATSANMIRARPLFGFGFGTATFQREKAAYYAGWGGVSPRAAVYPNNPHNDALNLLVMLGLTGLLAWLAVVGAIWRLLARQRRGGDAMTAELAGCVQAMCLVLLLNGQFHSVLHMGFAQVVCGFFVGIVAAMPLAAEPVADAHRPTAVAGATHGVATLSVAELPRRTA